MKRDTTTARHGFAWWCGGIVSVFMLAACGAAPLAQTTVTAPTPTTAPVVNVPPAPTSTSAPVVVQPATLEALPEPASTPQSSAPFVPPLVCAPGTALTPAQTEGPYYKPDTPDRSSLLEATPTGTKLIVTGYVLTSDCQPVVGAWLDFWQADDEGAYDHAGYNFRGHQTTDATGRYQLETVIPGLYPGRTRHIHVKVQAPNGPILTTQLYFPDEPANTRDGIFDPALIVDLQTTATGDVATFNFVIKTQ